MATERPDPDALLQALRTSGERNRGRLKIYFGAAAGVGKTYAMLHEALALHQAGRDVVAGVIETHGREETAELLADLPQLPLREVDYRGVKLHEFDLNAAITRRPEVLLVDELAHTNAPGSRHAKRWQDVEELLDAGIDVNATLNVQHLESLNDIVAQISGVIVRETLPDAVLERADEVELVDISPEDLLERLRAGKVYVSAQAQRALANFFNRANITALRELALRTTAQQVDTQLQAQRTLAHAAATWPAMERIIVCVGSGPLSAGLVRSARRLAAETHAEWEAVYVETATSRQLPAIARGRVEHAMRLAEQLGATAVTLSGEQVAETLVAYARQRNASKILVGRPTHAPWLDRVRGSLVESLIRYSGDMDVYVVRAKPDQAPESGWPAAAYPRQGKWPDYAVALGIIATATALLWVFRPHLQPANTIMVYLLAVALVALRASRGAAILACMLAVAAFDFFFVSPFLTFAVSDLQYLLTFGVMLAVSVIIADLTYRLKQQVLEALARERRTSSLYQFSRELSAQQGAANVARLIERHLSGLFQCDVLVLLALARGSTAGFAPQQRSLFASPDNELAVAQWCIANAKPAGRGTATLPGSEALHFPLSAARGVLGVLILKPARSAPARWRMGEPQQQHLLEACTALASTALERELQAETQQQTELRAQQEHLRSTLLSSLSHDLRTPLAGITGSADTLLTLPDGLTQEEARGLLLGIRDEGERLRLLLDNILDLTRLESGEVKLRLEPQTLEEIAGSALAELEQRLTQRPLEVRIPPDLPLIQVDAVLVERVLVNLLDNALRYTPEGSPLLLEAVQDGGVVQVRLADRGPGLGGLEPEHLFERFSRTGDSRGTSVKGSRGLGLGLSICKAIVEAHGGTITASDRPGGGALFSFTLPVSTAESSSALTTDPGRAPRLEGDGP
jgi:two-component system sensor histidine kinase KdpD